MPARENAFRNLILNQRVAAEARFIDQAAWRACSGEPNIPARRPVYAVNSTPSDGATELNRRKLGNPGG